MAPPPALPSDPLDPSDFLALAEEIEQDEQQLPPGDEGIEQELNLIDQEIFRELLGL